VYVTTPAVVIDALPACGGLAIAAVSGSPSGSESLASTLIVPAWSSLMVRLSATATGGALSIVPPPPGPVPVPPPPAVTSTVTTLDVTTSSSWLPFERTSARNSWLPGAALVVSNSTVVAGL
jgi:hypothetical protein